MINSTTIKPRPVFERLRSARPDSTRIVYNVPCLTNERRDARIVPADVVCCTVTPSLETTGVSAIGDDGSDDGQQLQLVCVSRNALSAFLLTTDDVSGKNESIDILDDEWCKALTGRDAGLLLASDDHDDADEEQQHRCRQFPRVLSYAMNYTGYQFGVLPGQLGDGRCVTILESSYQVHPTDVAGIYHVGLQDAQKRRSFSYELQAKGGCKTPFSRHYDGLYVRRTAFREFILSEVLGRWGVPTSRCVALTLSSATAEREGVFLRQPTAIVTRVVPHAALRIGTFEHLFYSGKHETLIDLINYTIQTHFEDLLPQVSPDQNSAKMNHHNHLSTDVYLAFLERVAGGVGSMIATMQAIGFVHGALNTDNISIFGSIIDYGPCDFISGFDETLVVNPTDDVKGRYAFGKQVGAGFWAVQKFTESLSPLFMNAGDQEQEVVGTTSVLLVPRVLDAQQAYHRRYATVYRELMLRRLGFDHSIIYPQEQHQRLGDNTADHDQRHAAADTVIQATRHLLRQHKTCINYHHFFRLVNFEPYLLKPLFRDAVMDFDRDDSAGFGDDRNVKDVNDDVSDGTKPRSNNMAVESIDLYREWRSAYRVAQRHLPLLNLPQQQQQRVGAKREADRAGGDCNHSADYPLLLAPPVVPTGALIDHLYDVLALNNVHVVAQPQQQHAKRHQQQLRTIDTELNRILDWLGGHCINRQMESRYLGQQHQPTGKAVEDGGNVSGGGRVGGRGCRVPKQPNGSRMPQLPHHGANHQKVRDGIGFQPSPNEEDATPRNDKAVETRPTTCMMNSQKPCGCG